MVKGTARQIVLVKSPDPKLFEQAIFILREDALERHGVTEEDVMRQARKTAGAYLSSQLPGRRNRRAWLKRLAWFVCGAVSGCGVWLAAGLLR